MGLRKKIFIHLRRTRELMWNFRKSKERFKGTKRLWNTTRQLPDPTMSPQVGGQLFGVHLPIFNLILKQHQIFKMSYSHKVYLSFQKNYLSPNIPKSHQINYKTAKNRDMCYTSIGILYWLKRKRDICIKTIKPSQNTALSEPHSPPPSPLNYARTN